MIPESIASLFRKTPVEKKVSEDLHQARLDLLSAQEQAEYWGGMVRVLKTKVNRLEGHDAPAAPDAAPETPAAPEVPVAQETPAEQQG